MAKRKKKAVIEKIGTITVIQQLKMTQEWQGNQRGMVHKNKKAYTRKQKHKGKKDYDRDISKEIFVS